MPHTFKRKNMDNPFESEEFYELMQDYRHAAKVDQAYVSLCYERVKTFCLKVVADSVEQAAHVGLTREVINELKRSADSLERHLNTLQRGVGK